MGILKKLNSVLRKIEKFVVSAGIMLIGSLTIINVIARSVFNNSLSFVGEMNGFVIIMVTFLGTAYAAREGRHIRMSAIYDMLSKKYKKIMIYIMTSVTSLILFYMTNMSVKYAFKAFQRGKVSSVMTVPKYLIYMWVPIGLFIAAVQYGLAFIKNIKEDDVWLSFDKKSEYSDVEEELDDETNVAALEELEFEDDDIN